MKKNFSIMKWIIFPLLVLAFGSGIIFVSVKIFDVEGSIPSILLILICFAISLIFVLHTSNHNVKSAMIAAFAFECLGVLALAVTLICSIVVLREFSGATKTIESNTAAKLVNEQEKTKQITALGGLKSATAQRTLAKAITKPANKKDEPTKTEGELTLDGVYTKAERFLFWPLVGEAGVYLIGLLVVFGLVQFLGESSEKKTFANNSQDFLDDVLNLSPKRMKAPQRLGTFSTNKNRTVEDGNNHFLILLESGGGVSIRFREHGEQAKHVIRIPSDLAIESGLYSMDYRQLAAWTLTKLKAEGKDGKPIYETLETTL